MKQTFLLLSVVFTCVAMMAGNPATNSTIIPVVTNSNDSLAPETWNEEARKGFMDACVEGAKVSLPGDEAQNYCECMLEKIVVKYPNPIDAGEMTEEEATDMAIGCFE